MRFQLLGGNPEDELPVPWPETLPWPPFACVGEQEPFHHYVRLDSRTPIFVYVGECRGIDHRGAYPHVHAASER